MRSELGELGEHVDRDTQVVNQLLGGLLARALVHGLVQVRVQSVDPDNDLIGWLLFEVRCRLTTHLMSQLESFAVTIPP
nr:hypothetical protein GCM10017611_78990 [Rhodococcus wratislaviensis]